MSDKGLTEGERCFGGVITTSASPPRLAGACREPSRKATAACSRSCEQLRVVLDALAGARAAKNAAKNQESKQPEMMCSPRCVRSQVARHVSAPWGVLRAVGADRAGAAGGGAFRRYDDGRGRAGRAAASRLRTIALKLSAGATGRRAGRGDAAAREPDRPEGGGSRRRRDVLATFDPRR